VHLGVLGVLTGTVGVLRVQVQLGVTGGTRE